MNTALTLRGLGHRGRLLAHQLTLERPPHKRSASSPFELVVIDLDDPRIELSLLASSLHSHPGVQRRIALALLPNVVDLQYPPAVLRALQEQFDAWVPILPYEVVHPTQTLEEGFSRGFLPTLRRVMWQFVRLTSQHDLNSKNLEDYSELWTGGRAMWSYQVSTHGQGYLSEACDLLEAYVDEPLFWNATSTRWILQITCNPNYVQPQDIIHMLNRFSEEPYGVEECCWSGNFDPELSDEIILDVLAIGEVQPQAVSQPALCDVHRLS